MVEKVEEDAKAEVDVNKPTTDTVLAAAKKSERNEEVAKVSVEVVSVNMFSREQSPRYKPPIPVIIE